jgi:enoyl-CoA hydratase/3-hydroxyacyl-CoA dehydrogenase
MEEGEHYRPAPIFRSVENWITVKPGTPVEVDPELAAAIRNRLLGVLFSQSFDIIDRGIGTREDLNLGCQIALGFRKGPFDIMRDLGGGKVTRIITDFQKARPGMPGMKNDYSDYQDFKRNILVEEMDGVKIITIRRPQFMNALNEELNTEILAILKQYETDPSVEGFVITGYGDRAFSAGAEIGKFPKVLGNAEASVQYSRDCSHVLRYLDSAEKPVVAAINGMALGGGFELAIRCHKMVATKKAWFQFPEVTLGILPGIGGLVVPYRRWTKGSPVFHDMLRLATRLSAEKARDLGIVSVLTDDYFSLIQAAATEVRNLKGKVERIPDGPVKILPPEPIEKAMAGNLRLSDQVVAIITDAIPQAAKASSFEEALEIGYRAFGSASCTEAAKEGISAFMEKRPPQFKN